MAGITQINTIGRWLKQNFGEKVVKLSIDGGFTCPNRDGSIGHGGCIFCSPEGSGELSSNIKDQISLLSKKWPNVKSYIAYFQSHTNTYAPAEELRKKYYEALNTPGVVGIAIATRPDCLPEDVLNLLSELNEKTFLWVELGLQTIHGDRINRGYTLDVYDKSFTELKKRGIRVVTHLILGLPEESKEDMLSSVTYVTKQSPFGIKLHLMNVIKGSSMETLYPGYIPFDSPEEYINLVCDIIETVPEHITIHRLTGDVPRKLLIAPTWSYKKRTILNGIAGELKKRGTHQGSAL